jgi:DNA repair protein RadC
LSATASSCARPLLQEVLDRAATLLAQRFRTDAAVLDKPERTRQFLRHQIGSLPYELFGILLLDTRHRLIRTELLFRGTIAAASVHPREVARVVLESNAAAVIFFHNHPSGLSEPSQADELITRRLIQALQLLEVRVLDHLIIGDTVYSFVEAGCSSPVVRLLESWHEALARWCAYAAPAHRPKTPPSVPLQLSAHR